MKYNTWQGNHFRTVFLQWHDEEYYSTALLIDMSRGVGGIFSAQVSLRNIKVNKFKKLRVGLLRAFNVFWIFESAYIPCLPNLFSSLDTPRNIFQENVLSIRMWSVLGIYTFGNVEDLLFPVTVMMLCRSHMLLLPDSMLSRCFPSVD